MSILLVVDSPKNWPLHIPDVKVIAARAYLTDSAYSEARTAKVFNLCRSYRYQTVGYYVSLLAAARGHKPLPDVTTIQDLKSQIVIRTLSEDLNEEIQSTLRKLQSRRFVLSIYFGHNFAKRYEALGVRLFNLFQAPMLRAEFVRRKAWELETIRPISVNEIPESHREFVIEAATQYFAGRNRRLRRRQTPRYDLAVLVNPGEVDPPSDEKALQRFQKAAEAVGLDFELITRDEFHRLAVFDALFIRETTAVNHHTFRFAQRATAEGMVVMDDPQSILKCTNKVYLAELLQRHNVSTPKTLVVHKQNRDQIIPQLGLPCVLKQPDSAFSRGVTKIETKEELEKQVNRLLSRSDLVIAQEYLPTSFDWRVGICDRRALYVCRYYMAHRHWQVIQHAEDGTTMKEGHWDTISVGEAPDELIKTALKACNLIGDGLYGVDVKQVNNKFYIIEVNDNPSIEAGCEDLVLKGALYRDIMGVFLKRIEHQKRGPAG
ncbi:MAG: RimK family protein [Gammaproteobacteria bacterium]|nr:RimK family protein [Gammaproteobacteria bacterium]